ncbi:MAG: hypothetical protein KAQ70_05950 [Candidatus Heimdallarchaeota archaeon]|nr:hypothetical protein [Candidatus Heimdallarchaeota archaeon]
MVLGRIKVHCSEQDIQIIMKEVKSKLKELSYKVKKPKEDYLQYQTLRVVKNSYQWLLDFHIKLDRTGNLVNIEITRVEFFSIDKIISDRVKRTNQGNQQRSFFRSIFRFWWLFFIISIVGSLLLSFLPNTGNPLTTVGYVLLGILGVFLVFYFASGMIRSYQKKNEIEKANILTEQLKAILQSLNTGISETTIICWNCFKEITPVNSRCPECKKQLVKV